MKYQGLVVLFMLGMAGELVAQRDSDLNPNFQPPLPGVNDLLPALPATLPSSPNASFNIEAELEQFRHELKQLHEMQEELARNIKSTDAESERVAAQQRQELMDLVTKIARQGTARKAAALAAAREQQRKATAAAENAAREQMLADQAALGPSEADDPSASESLASAFDAANPLVAADITDAFALGKVLFNKGEYANAEKAFRRAKVDPGNEMTLKYLIATCLRRQNKWRAATELYKVVAESDQDPVLQRLAKWQIDNIRWTKESESQLEQLKKQRDKRIESSKSASVRSDARGQ
jgi:tetratricopeptide (TPR) repeat protein